jgi:glycine/betaine/sarcosine/D-proline reductase family selenoprotein B
MTAAMERADFPVVHITAVPTVSKMIGVNRLLRGLNVTCVLGNIKLSRDLEKALRRKYVLRALELLQMDIKGKQIFTLEGSE